MDATGYLLGGFAAQIAIMLLFPVHCFFIAGGLFFMGICFRKIFE